jgi:hypothetical protein
MPNVNGIAQQSSCCLNRTEFYAAEGRFKAGEPQMAKKVRPWTATDVHKLRGLARKKVEVERIARTLKRTVEETKARASTLNICLDASVVGKSRSSTAPNGGNIGSQG